MDKLYHSAKKRGGLQRPQDFDKKQPYTVLPSRNNNDLTNGENK